MKQRDAERIAKATEALLDRLRAAAEKLKSREQAILTAIETLVSGINEGIQKDFEKWDALSDLDPDAEIAPSMVAPVVDLDGLTTAFEEAFEAAHSGIEGEIGEFGEILDRANEYEEPEEEEEVVYTCACDHPRCLVDGPERPTDAEAQKAALAIGWLVDSEGTYCPEHHPAPGETGEHFGCHSQGCEAESPGCDTLDEAEEAAQKAGWKFDPEGWAYCPKHRSQA